MSNSTRKVPYDRLPTPITLAWVSAHRATSAQVVHRSAELTMRVLLALVLGDLLDLEWPAPLAANEWGRHTR